MQSICKVFSLLFLIVLPMKNYNFAMESSNNSAFYDIKLESNVTNFEDNRIENMDKISNILEKESDNLKNAIEELQDKIQKIANEELTIEEEDVNIGQEIYIHNSIIYQQVLIQIMSFAKEINGTNKFLYITKDILSLLVENFCFPYCKKYSINVEITKKKMYKMEEYLFFNNTNIRLKLANFQKEQLLSEINKINNAKNQILDLLLLNPSDIKNSLIKICEKNKYIKIANENIISCFELLNIPKFFIFLSYEAIKFTYFNIYAIKYLMENFYNNYFIYKIYRD